MRKILNTDAAIMPPNTGVPTAWRVSAPARNSSKDEGEARHHHWTEPQPGSLNGGHADALSGAALLHRKRHDQDAVLRGKRDQHNEANLRVDVEAKPRQCHCDDGGEHGDADR
jgi:hypothetical protein